MLWIIRVGFPQVKPVIRLAGVINTALILGWGCGSMSKLMRFLVFAVVINLGVAVAFGQERRGSISGYATDINHDPLVGARVEVQPSGRAVTTDLQGAFTI